RDLAEALRKGMGGTKSAVFKNSKIDEQSMAKLLRSYGIRPTTMRIGTEVYKGYELTDFKEALNRYVPRSEADLVFDEESRRRELGVEAWEEYQRQAAER